MQPILDLIAESEAAASAAAEALRAQIAVLTAQLAVARASWLTSRSPARPC